MRTNTKPTRVSPVTADVHPDAMLRVSQILGTETTTGLLKIGRTNFYSLIKKGAFPKPEKLGQISLWKASDVLLAIRNLAGGAR